MQILLWVIFGFGERDVLLDLWRNLLWRVRANSNSNWWNIISTQSNRQTWPNYKCWVLLDINISCVTSKVTKIMDFYNSIFATSSLDSLLNQLLSWWNIITPLIRLDLETWNIDKTHRMKQTYSEKLITTLFVSHLEYYNPFSTLDVERGSQLMWYINIWLSRVS